MTPHTTTPDLRPLRDRLATLRAAMRRLYLTDGVFRAGLTLLGLLTLSFVFDRTLELPPTVRLVHNLVSLAIVVAVLVRFVVVPLSVRLSDEDLALAVEARRPELQDRLISALQFARQIEDPENNESEEMIRAVLTETEQLAGELDVKSILSSRGARRLGMAFAVLLLLTGGYALANPDAVSIWLRRAALENVAWPRATTLVVEEPAEPSTVLTRGDDFSVVVRIDGETPDEVRIFYRPLDEAGVGKGTLENRRMYRSPGEAGEPDRFQFEFRNVPRSFEFHVKGGDDDDEEPVYRVRALVPPRVSAITADCAFPDFTGLPSRTFARGDLQVPVGTRVTLSFGATLPGSEARLLREGRQEIPLTSPAPDRYVGTFVVESSFEYSIELIGDEGQRNRIEDDTYRVVATPDRRPQVRVVVPAAIRSVTSNALLPLKVMATDNYGVESLQLLHRIGLEGPRRISDLAIVGPAGGREVIAFDPREVSEMSATDERAPTAGSVLVFRVKGRDNGGLEDETDDIRISIVSPEELERSLGDRQKNLKEDAEQARRAQDEGRSKTRILVTYFKTGGDVDLSVIDRLRDVQVDQSRVTREVIRFRGGVQRVLDAYVFNRLSSPIAGRPLLEIYRRQLSEDRTDLGRPFKPELYREIVEKYRAGKIFDPEVVGILIELIDISSEIADETSPRAHELVSGVVSRRSDDPHADLVKAEKAQAAALAAFDMLMAKMKRWETYHEFIIKMQELEALQNSITESARKALSRPK